MLDIHKVKPVHGWREFIGEVGIIVLGVLIALALEQVVEFVHWHNKVQETMDAVKDSAANHIFAATEQQMTMPCIEQQLDSLEARLLAKGPFDPARLRGDGAIASYVVRAPTRQWVDSVWSTVISEGVSTHYNHDQRYVLDSFYSGIGEIREIAHQADDLNSQLNTLARPVAKTDAMVLQFTQTIERLRAKEELLTLMSRQAVYYARYINIIPPARELKDAVYQQSGTLSFCQKNHYKTRSFNSIDFTPIVMPKH